MIPVSNQGHTTQSDYLDQVSADLSRSIKRCHLILDDYRAQLMPANSNEAPFMLGKCDPENPPEG
jgi:hypothetical protein